MQVRGTRATVCKRNANEDGRSVDEIGRLYLQSRGQHAVVGALSAMALETNDCRGDIEWWEGHRLLDDEMEVVTATRGDHP